MLQNATFWVCNRVFFSFSSGFRDQKCCRRPVPGGARGKRTGEGRHLRKRLEDRGGEALAEASHTRT